MRKYIRHPTEIPVEYHSLDGHNGDIHEAKNIGLGGMSFKSTKYEEKGSIIDLRIPSVHPNIHIKGKVVWCLEQRDGVEIGVKFLDSSAAFSARIVEQICYIKHYQKKIWDIEGRKLTDEQAAREWIEKYASDF